MAFSTGRPPRRWTTSCRRLDRQGSATYAAVVRSSELTAEELARLRAATDGHLDYYLRLWRRVQANDMPFHDPLATAVSEAWESLDRAGDLVEVNVSEVPHVSARPPAGRGPTTYPVPPDASTNRPVAQMIDIDRRPARIHPTVHHWGTRGPDGAVRLDAAGVTRSC